MKSGRAEGSRDGRDRRCREKETGGFPEERKEDQR